MWNVEYEEKGESNLRVGGDGLKVVRKLKNELAEQPLLFGLESWIDLILYARYVNAVAQSL